MKPGLAAGVRGELTITVTDQMCPEFDGRVVHRVYSTWSLAHHMELAARKVLLPFLEEHEEGLGTHLSIDHLGLTPVGKSVRVIAEAREVGDGQVICDVLAYDGERMVARGTQIQRVLNKGLIKELIERYE